MLDFVVATRQAGGDDSVAIQKLYVELTGDCQVRVLPEQKRMHFFRRTAFPAIKKWGSLNTGISFGFMLPQIRYRAAWKNPFLPSSNDSLES
ncbi:MAG TPA: hypothetical protein VGM52_17880 [Herbaspirillum sp.]|jgi:hypothetical protein